MGEPIPFSPTVPAPRPTEPSAKPQHMAASAEDMVHAPPHYTRLSPEPLDVIEAWALNFHEGSALKYLARWRYKGGTEDLRKAAQLLLRLAELEDRR